MPGNPNKFDKAQFEQQLQELESITLTDAQKNLLDHAGVSADHDISEMHVATNIYMINRYQMMVDQLIASNERLSASTEKHAGALVRATWALAIATGVLVLATLALVGVGFLQGG